VDHRPTERPDKMLRYKGSAQFRQRIVFATLSGRAVRIDDIRAGEDQVGLKDYEASFLRLLEKVVNGCEIVINETGTAMRYRPGIIVGGSGLVHECGTSRAISYFAQPLMMLAPFAKAPLSITLRGVTNASGDVGIDALRTVTLPLLTHFGLSEGLALHVNKRGAPPDGGGEVHLQMSIVRELTPCDLVEAGLVKRVRGVAYGAKVSPQILNRLVDSSRAVLNNFLPDVWVYTDVHKGKTSGASAGFGVSLVAETTSGALLAAELMGQAGELPEHVGLACADGLLAEVGLGGAIDAINQPLVLTLMTLGPEDVSRVRLGRELTPASVGSLRLLRDFLGVTFRIEADADGSLLLACRGCGFKNHSQRVT